MSSPNPSVSEVSDPETASQRSQSRSQSRRARRRRQQNRRANTAGRESEQQQQSLVSANTESQALVSRGGSDPVPTPARAQHPPTVEETGMQPFEWIGPDATSMDGPVTFARAQRGEIPARPGNPKQALRMAGESGGDGGDDDIMKQDGLKLRLDLNLDIELELKARLRGDLTLSLL